MKVYLDTNILIFALMDDDELSADVKAIMDDCSNLMYTSSVCIHEAIHLCQIGKLENTRKKKARTIRPEVIMQMVKDFGIEIIPVSCHHLAVYASMPIDEDHRDPNDRLIIAQAIADRVPLVSSDRKFSRYVRHGLSFIFNER